MKLLNQHIESLKQKASLSVIAWLKENLVTQVQEEITSSHWVFVNECHRCGSVSDDSGRRCGQSVWWISSHGTTVSPWRNLLHWRRFLHFLHLHRSQDHTCRVYWYVRLRCITSIVTLVVVCFMSHILKNKTRSSATALIAHDADDVETAIQGHSRSSNVVPIDVAYMTSC